MKGPSVLLIVLLVFLGLEAVTCKHVRDSEPQCYVDGVFYRPEEDIPHPNPCTSCSCQIDAIDEDNNGRVCSTAMCDWPTCSGGHWPITSPEICCAYCPDTNTCFYDEVEYEEGELIPKEDPCVECICDPSSIHQSCRLTFCTSPTCDDPVSIPGVCCPVCPD